MRYASCLILVLYLLQVPGASWTAVAKTAPKKACGCSLTTGSCCCAGDSAMLSCDLVDPLGQQLRRAPCAVGGDESEALAGQPPHILPQVSRPATPGKGAANSVPCVGYPQPPHRNPPDKIPLV